jgi:hypothetical protein
LEKYITSVCFEVFSTCVKTSFFMRLVKTLCQNLGQILPESFYRILGKVGFHDTLRPALASLTNTKKNTRSLHREMVAK